MYLGNVTKPMLFVSGTNDFAYHLDILEASCALPVGDVSRCIRIEMPHGHECGWAPKEIGIFADQHLINGTPLPAISACEHAQGVLKAHFTNTCPVLKGYIIYTKCRGNWKDRKWLSAPAKLADGVVEATLPEDVSACFMAIEDERGAYASSPCLGITTDLSKTSV